MKFTTAGVGPTEVQCPLCVPKHCSIVLREQRLTTLKLQYLPVYLISRGGNRNFQEWCAPFKAVHEVLRT